MENFDSEDRMRVGYLQCAPFLGDRDATIRKIDALIMPSLPCDLLVLPELCNSGYHFVSYEQAWETSEALESSVFIQFLGAKCTERAMHIVAGFNERGPDGLYNSAVLVGPHGVIGTYRKLHLFLNEKDFFKPGNQGLPVFNIGKCTIGILICFDWIFPEAWRVVALKGADLVCHPSNLVLPGLAQRGVPVQALMNRVYAITANRTGIERNLTFTGCSTIASPRGDVLLQASAAEETIGIVEVDIGLARDKKITPRNDLFADRRPEEYACLLAPHPHD
jgi:predicted amidohydrolase